MDKDAVVSSLAVIRANGSHALSDTDDYDNDLFEELLKLDVKKAELQKLLGPSKGADAYTVDKVCSGCNGLFTVHTSKSGLVDAYGNYLSDLGEARKPRWRSVFTCHQCKIDENDKRQSALQERDESKSPRTEEYIERYLDYNSSWIKTVPHWERMQDLKVSNIDGDAIAMHIKGMDYRDFLNTPYWKAISVQIMKKYKFKCAVCNSDGMLNVHHKTYDNHGYELSSMDDLVCLCSGCHSTHHGH